jgi:dipeptidyl-peptidase 4
MRKSRLHSRVVLNLGGLVRSGPFWLLAWLSALPAPAEDSTNREWITLDGLFTRQEFKGEEWGPARWLKDNSGYTTLETSGTNKEAKDIVRYEPGSGRREVLVSAARLVPRGESKPLRIEDYAWSDDTRKLLVFTNSKRVWRKNTRGDYWVLDRKDGSLRKLGGAAPPSSLMFTTFSPDGRRVAYVCQNNLFVQELANWRITRLTRDGSETLINGTSDWVNEEEFHLRNAFRWSPDSRRVAYWQFDTSSVREYRLINDTEGLYPKVTSFPYPKVGETNSACRVGVVRANGGATCWFQANRDPRNHYIPELLWMPDSKSILFQQLNRLQNTNQIIRGEVGSGKTGTVLTDWDAAWVDAAEEWHWADPGKRLLWLSERSGWQQLYSVSCTNQEIQLLTPGAYDVLSIAGVDPSGGYAYVIASPDNPTQRYLYRVRLDGRGNLERVSPMDQPGTHSYDVSKDGRWAFHTYSRFGEPSVVDLVSLPEHQRARVFVENSKLRTRLRELRAVSNEFFRVDIGGGTQLDAWCIKPPDFNPAKTYPVVFHVYGEPAGQTVLDRWGGETYLWHWLLAQQGYLVMSVDNRGTPAPRGREWRRCIYRQVGILASADQAEAVRRILKDRPYVDSKRVGIWGWSGGGSMTLNAIFRYPDLYTTAIAVAFVSNQRYYDTIYQERYMGLPGDNEEGYTQGSPITFAKQLKGHLLLVYGTGDDNCHYQNCEALINELVKQNKLFSLMAYPNRTHGISEGANTRRHFYETLTRYLRENLPAGVR